jgi:predicted nucleic acid-binding protein
VIFVDTGFFFALFAAEERERHRKARELLETLSGRTLSDVFVTTDYVVLETITSTVTSLTVSWCGLGRRKVRCPRPRPMPGACSSDSVGGPRRLQAVDASLSRA